MIVVAVKPGGGTPSRDVARLMEVVVFPYIICSLLHGLGRVTPATAWRLFRCSWHLYLTVWGITFPPSPLCPASGRRVRRSTPWPS